MLSDQSGEGRKAYSVPRSLMGLAPGRITFFIDSQGVVRYVTFTLRLGGPPVDRDPRHSEVYDSLLDFNGHVKAVSQALERYKDAGKPGDTAAAASESAPAHGA
jgi:peroxiredoxin Q/BCP